LAVVSRRRLLAVLRAAAAPMDVAALADAVGLHVTTARFHLEVLERAGLVSRAAERAGRPGRPRQLYVAVEALEVNEGHRRLAEALVDVLAADPDGGEQWAERAGRQWAEREVPADAELSLDEGIRWVSELFDRLGFAPRLVEDSQGRHVELYACPFRDLARSYPQVVCTVHAGLLRGALGRLHVPFAESARLRPFVAPELCIADIPKVAGGRDEALSEPAR
jgi:predicted ArsR family transcriptional regulator